MPQSYTQLYYHIVWATKERRPLLTPAVLQVVLSALRSKGKECGAVTYAVNGVADHLHLAVRLPATVALAKYVEAVKGYGSWRVNHTPDTDEHLYWQPGYGALTFRKADLTTVVRYIERQAEHHSAQTLWPEFERTEEP